MDHSHRTSELDIDGRRDDIGRRPRWAKRRTSIVIGSAALLVIGLTGAAAWAASGTAAVPLTEIQTLDGTNNNLANPNQGARNTRYARVAPHGYRDGVSQPNNGPNARLISNRLVNDIGQNVFTGRSATQWLWQWGQFVDHDIALAQGGGEPANIPFNANDPQEEFQNDLGVIGFTRDAAHPGTGTGAGNPREHTNTISSYLDATNVYGGTAARLDWLRDGSLDGNPTNNRATIMLQGGFLPTRDARGDVTNAPEMAIDGRLRVTPAKATVAGDVRANENIGLNATHNLFALEHNRIVSRLPNTLSDEAKFQIARSVVIAEQQFITYNEFLPAAGVRLPAYTGYKSNVNASIGTEFATVGYRAHSMVHGEFEFEVERDRYTAAQLAAFEAQGLEIIDEGGEEIEIAIPLNLAFFNSPLLRQIGLGEMLTSIGGEAQYNNDEMFDSHMRSVLFQIPRAGQTDCIEPVDPVCFNGVTDLFAIDVARTHEHGIPNYNILRQSLGLPARTSFRAITGESTENFPAGLNGDNPASLAFTELFDKNGAPIALDSPAFNAEATEATRRTTKAARLKAVFGTVDKVDAFSGMISEPKVAGTEFGALQLAMWSKQFAALRDGDRFHYLNDPRLSQIRATYGIDFRRNLGDIIADNTDVPRDELRDNVFVIPNDEALAPGRILGTASTRCVDVPASNPTNGTRVQLFDCNATAAQGFQQFSNRQLRVLDGTKCLDVFRSGKTPGTAVQIWDCHNGLNQQFRFNRNGTIVGVDSGLCVAPVGGGTGRGTRLETQQCNGSASQRWIR